MITRRALNSHDLAALTSLSDELRPVVRQSHPEVSERKGSGLYPRARRQLVPPFQSRLQSAVFSGTQLQEVDLMTFYFCW